MQAAYYALHYGCDYLAWSIKSIQDAVDEIHVFYVSSPSYGHTQGIPCPESRDELKQEAERFCNKPLHWHDCETFMDEGTHRKHAVNTLQSLGAHQILVVDSDEIWLPSTAKMAMYEATKANRLRNWQARFVHFIRSTKYAITDHFLPVRILDLRHGAGQGVLPEDVPPVMHFGYAQSEKIIRYKWTCHGHQIELRPDWMNRFMSWTPETQDLHPVVIDLWPKALQVEPKIQEALTVALEGHPYLDVDIIR